MNHSIQFLINRGVAGRGTTHIPISIQQQQQKQKQKQKNNKDKNRLRTVLVREALAVQLFFGRVLELRTRSLQR